MDLSVGECSSERSRACYLILLPIIQIVVRFSYDNFQTQMMVERKLMSFFYCRAPFQFNNYPSESRVSVKKVIYDVPRPSSIHDHRVYSCCGLFKLEKWEVRYIAVQTSYSLTDDSYLSLRHPFVISVTRIVLPRQILFYTRNVFIYVCLYLFVPFVISLILLILVYVCTSPNLIVAQKQQFL